MPLGVSLSCMLHGMDGTNRFQISGFRFQVSGVDNNLPAGFKGWLILEARLNK